MSIAKLYLLLCKFISCIPYTQSTKCEDNFKTLINYKKILTTRSSASRHEEDDHSDPDRYRFVCRFVWLSVYLYHSDPEGTGLSAVCLTVYISEPLRSKNWFYYKKMSFILRKLSRSSNCTWLQEVHVCAPYQKRTLPKYLTSAVHCMLLVTWPLCCVSSDVLVV